MSIVKLLKVSLILYIIFFLLFIQFYFKKLFVTETLNMVTINQDNATIVYIGRYIYIPTYIYKKNKNKKSFTDYFLFIYMNLPFCIQYIPARIQCLLLYMHIQLDCNKYTYTILLNKYIHVQKCILRICITRDICYSGF